MSSRCITQVECARQPASTTPACCAGSSTPASATTAPAKASTADAVVLVAQGSNSIKRTSPAADAASTSRGAASDQLSTCHRSASECTSKASSPSPRPPSSVPRPTSSAAVVGSGICQMHPPLVPISTCDTPSSDTLRTAASRSTLAGNRPVRSSDTCVGVPFGAASTSDCGAIAA
eukprot:719902-Prymnesium_polylepis.3